MEPTTPVSIDSTAGLKAPIIPLIEAFITRNATAPASAAVPLSFLASPTERPIHIISAKLPNTTSPADDIILNIPCNQGISKNG